MGFCLVFLIMSVFSLILASTNASLEFIVLSCFAGLTFSLEGMLLGILYWRKMSAGDIAVIMWGVVQ